VWLDDHRTALYRFFDEGGALLYVGITANLEARWLDHERLKSWWPLVASKTVEWFDTRPSARAAELLAMEKERPIHNVANSPWAPPRRELVEDELTITQLRANLTEYCTRVRLQDTAFFVVGINKKRDRIAVIVPFDFYERACAALGEERVPAEQPEA
jgi:predicted GIY-YIG superfamily endonuclease